MTDYTLYVLLHLKGYVVKYSVYFYSNGDVKHHVMCAGWKRLLCCSESSGSHCLCDRDRSYLCPAGLVRKTKKSETIFMPNALHVKTMSILNLLCENVAEPVCPVCEQHGWI